MNNFTGESADLCFKDYLDIILKVPESATQFSMNVCIYQINGTGYVIKGGSIEMDDSLAEKIKDLVTIEKVGKTEKVEKPDAIITYTATVKTKIYEPAE